MTNLPETVQWVLDFLNINKISGKFNPHSYPIKSKRIPIPQKKNLPNIVIENDLIIDKSTGNYWKYRRKVKEPEVDTFKLTKDLEEIEAKIRELLEKKSCIAGVRSVDKKKYEEEKRQNELDAVRKLVSSKDIEKDIEFVGNINDALSLKECKDFFLKNGIPPFKGKKLLLENGKPLSSLNIKSYNDRPKNNSEDGFYNYYQDNPRIEHTFFCEVVENVHCRLERILSNMMWDTKTYKDERKATEDLDSYMRQIIDLYLEFWKGNEVPADSGITPWGARYRGRYAMVIDSMLNKEPFPHYGMIPHALHACILDFGINHKELHQYLRQCSYCGRFWILEKKRGRPEKFCSDVCRERHDDQTREANKKSSKTSKKHKKRNDPKKIMSVLKRKHGENAEKYYKQEIEGKINTYKDFVRRQGKYYKLKP